MSAEVAKSKPYVRVATREDCFDLAPRLREADRQEIAHAHGLEPVQSLLIGFHSGETFAAVYEGRVIALFGCTGIPGVAGCPWMLASPELQKFRKQFVQECRPYCLMMLAVYRHLENRVWCGNTVHIRWLKWLGFTFDPPAPYGIHGEPFKRFYMTTKNV